MHTLVRLVSPQDTCEMEVADGDGSLRQWLDGTRHPLAGVLSRQGRVVTGRPVAGGRKDLLALCGELVAQAQVAVLTGYRRMDRDDLWGVLGEDYPAGGRQCLWGLMPDTFVMDLRPRGEVRAVSLWAMQNNRCVMRLPRLGGMSQDILLLSHFDAPRRVILGHVTPHEAAAGLDDPAAEIHIGMGDMDRIVEMAGMEKNGNRGKKS